MIGLRAYLALGGAAALLIVGGLHLAGDAATQRDRDTWRTAARDYKAAAEGWQRSYRASEDIRAAEKAEGRAAASEASSACDARVAEARRSARAIERIVTKEPARDQNGCPRRDLVPADWLSDALKAPAR